MRTRLFLQGNSAPLRRAPDYVDYLDYYFWGLRGERQLNLPSICLEQKPLAFERLRTFEDNFITVVTLGIYAPMTVRVWCGD